VAQITVQMSLSYIQNTAAAVHSMQEYEIVQAHQAYVITEQNNISECISANAQPVNSPGWNPVDYRFLLVMQQLIR